LPSSSEEITLRPLISFKHDGTINGFVMVPWTEGVDIESSTVQFFSELLWR